MVEEVLGLNVLSCSSWAYQIFVKLLGEYLESFLLLRLLVLTVANGSHSLSRALLQVPS